jgi:two-component system response regulator YesN
MEVNMSFSLLIVDDEKLTRESLLEYVNWKQFDIHTIQTASGGAEALKLMETAPPDILLCDIKMPRMTGIELASKVREYYPDCKIIFLSGYSDKEYLLSAIVLKVENYIEKPIDVEAIEKVISEVVASLREERIKKTSTALLVTGLAESFPIVKQEIALSLINPQKPFSATKNKFIPLYFNWPDNGFFTAICIHSDHNIVYWTDSKLLINQIYHFLDNKDSPIPLDFFAGQVPSGEIALIVKNIDRSMLHTLLMLLKNHLYDVLRLSVTIGISSTKNHLLEIPAAFNESLEAALQMFYLGYQQIITYSPIDKKLMPLELFKNLEINLDGIERLFDTLKTEKYSDIAVIRHHLYQVYLTMMERTLNDAVMPFDAFKQFPLSQYKELICYGMKALKTLGDDTYPHKIKEAVHFILWHYSNPNLSVKMIADSIDLSQNYLCSLFKQHTHSTINDFIIDVRIEKAKNLLKRTDLRLYEISTKVGLMDPNYLSVLFKKCSGCTPSEYRRRQK